MIYCVVNPAAGSGKGAKQWGEIEDYLKKAKVEYNAFMSQKHGHVAELVHSITTAHIDEAEPITLIILGGDGTLDEALQGIADFDRVNLGYIPIGSSNDFNRAMGPDITSVDKIKHILQCTSPRILDLGLLEYVSMSSERSRIHSGEVPVRHYFDVSCGIGFDANICEEALNANSKAFLNKIGLGKLTYGTICLKQLFSGDLTDAKLILDREKEVYVHKLRFIVGMNTCYEGGGFKFAPNAVPDDGYLDICAVGNISSFGILCKLPMAVKGKHINNRNVTTYRAKSFEVITNEAQWVHTDGEVYTKASHIKVSVVPHKLRYLE